MHPGRKVTVSVKVASELEERMPLEIYEGLFGEWRDSERRANPCNAKWSEVLWGARGTAAVCRWRWFIRWLEKQVCRSSWNGPSSYFYAEIIIVAFPAQEIANRELTGKQDSAPITSHLPTPSIRSGAAAGSKGDAVVIHCKAEVEALPYIAFPLSVGYNFPK